MEFLQDQSLKTYNTFGIDQKCAWFCVLNHENELHEIRKFLEEYPMEILIIGGGSNLLLTKDFDGLVVKNNLKGIKIEIEKNDKVYVKTMAGEVWHNLVKWTIDHGFGGLENLSLIPGCVGAAPMQNIGAYGVELKDTFFELEAIHLKTGEKKIFTNVECRFGYRESVFKNEVKGQYIIVSVTFKLSKNPEFKTTYGAIREELDAMGVQELSTAAISQAVINIRSSKLPDPAKIGNAGSFFKNPVVTQETADRLKAEYPDMPVYPAADNRAKLAAGWLIEKAGWKGKTIDDRYGVHKLQALVLVNYSEATGNEVYRLSEDILADIKSRFGIELEREVNII
ncbi:MAG: UDP-N-acetylmuramate dehydrogenase [Bacteroidota bacterium]